MTCIADANAVSIGEPHRELPQQGRLACPHARRATRRLRPVRHLQGPSSVNDRENRRVPGPYEDSLRHLGVKRQPRPGDDNSLTQDFLRFLAQADRYGALGQDARVRAPRVSLVRDFPFTIIEKSSGEAQSGSGEFLQRFAAMVNSGSISRAALCFNDSREDNRIVNKLLHPVQPHFVSQVVFDTVPRTFVQKALDRILANEGLPPTAKTAVLGAECGGDLRQAINALQLLLGGSMRLNGGAPPRPVNGRSTRGKKATQQEQGQAIDGTDGLKSASLGLFHALGRFLYCKRLRPGSTTQAETVNGRVPRAVSFVKAFLVFATCVFPLLALFLATRCQEGTMLKPMASRWGKTIPRFSAANATPGKVMEALRVQGCAIIERLIPEPRMTRISAELEPHVASRVLPADGADVMLREHADFMGNRTKRMLGVLAKSPTMSEMAAHPLVLGVADALLAPYCERIQLHIGMFRRLCPGEGMQPLHQDRHSVPAMELKPTRGEPGYFPGAQWGVAALWALSDCTAHNGATRLIPGSHLCSDVNLDMTLKRTEAQEQEVGWTPREEDPK
eukprot:s14_g11.t1